MQTQAGVTYVRNMDRKVAVLGFTTGAGGENPIGYKPALVFKRYENGYRLAEVWLSKDDGRDFPSFPGAKRLARVETKTGPSASESYVVAANWK